MTDPIEANRALWDEMAVHHVADSTYDVAGFRAGASSLHALEVEEVGPVAGQRLLHLQCHFGMDTLSWARRGAHVTGVDFSGQAIESARRLASEVAIEATFVESRVESLDLGRRFDIVFTSYGVLCWLPDLVPWALTVERHLAAGGVFYMAEIHPTAALFDDARGTASLRLRYPYFHDPEPMVFEGGHSYADPERRHPLSGSSHEWRHGLGDIVSALTGVGLRLEFLHEHAFTVYPMFPFLEAAGDGTWRLPPGETEIPLLFSLRMRR